ncbi:peptidoglycan recognition protein family protein [Bacillus timonensis]|uniref:peptidoglycan recognition protein family protein n=1 Tax=Bacillus timonensis TaxID=1033734 RepID=UPI002415B493|nr:N-acetylmuramoyl-L-alanine amidase [Bacillus timonensis]
MAVWINDFIKLNKYSRPGTKLKGKVKGILHFTANPGATAKNHVTYFGKSLIDLNERLPVKKRRYASAHIFVDRNEARCIIPLDEVAFAANDGTFRGVPELKPNANYLSISVEMCQEKDGSIHADTIKRTEDVFAELNKMFKWDPLKDIVRHYM